MVDWSRLTEYQADKHRSFEELCYQIARGLFQDTGRFTSIDDSGGGDGVEFYLTLPNGDQWGWQAKFYYPNPRLTTSNRKESIKGSLVTACREHPHLKRWILCTPTNFTPREQSWFEDLLPESIPQNVDVELEHWGDSEFDDWLSQPRFSGKRHHFFGDLELAISWFRTQVDIQMASVRDRFSPTLHVERGIDTKIHSLLGDMNFTQHVANALDDLEHELEGHMEAVTDLNSQRSNHDNWSDEWSRIIEAGESLQGALGDAVEQSRQALDLLSKQRLDDVRHLDWRVLWARIGEAYDAYRGEVSAFETSRMATSQMDMDQRKIQQEAEKAVSWPSWTAANLIDGLRGLLAMFGHISQPDLNILGNAGVGKTQVAANICYERINAEVALPALFVLGSHFTSDDPLQQQLLHILDIPATYSWNDFLQTLESVGQAYHTRIPLIIDGLNEATHNGAFSEVWRLGLRGLVREIAQTKNVVLITTCRTTYKEAVWPQGDPENVEYIQGFDDYDVLKAVEKYFSWYMITADLTGVSLSQFRHPIYLRIFCESQNAARQAEKHIYVGEHTLFEVFENYLMGCNEAICRSLGAYHRTPIVKQALCEIAIRLWEQHSRYVLLGEVVEAVDGQPLNAINWSRSKTKAILDEGLLILRDRSGSEDVVYFTFDLLGGYLIAKYLLQQAEENIEAYVRSEDAVTALFGDDYGALHPLHNDVGRCLAALLPIQTGRHLYELTDNNKAINLSVGALFEIPPDAVKQDQVDFMARLFENPRNRKHLLELAESTAGHVHHPFNAEFWSGLLKKLPMSDRDISWTEYVRGNAERFRDTVVRFEALCRGDELSSQMMTDRLNLLARHIMWGLRSSVRRLRDEATRALFYYGRMMPEQFFDLVLFSLEINDLYISERMLAAAYGVVMAQQHEFVASRSIKVPFLDYARKLYEAVFKPGASCATTHILARDYARRTIEIALACNTSLLTMEEQKRITPPFVDGGIREWGTSEDKSEEEYRNGNAPVHMDFGNYTMGRLVKGRPPYDFENDEYKAVRANIFWRIYDLGYSLDTFGDIDKSIARANWSYGRTTYKDKTERYGKKYSWIAFYELAGFRQDHGLLDESHDGVRISDADIDPSFPQSVQGFGVVEKDLLGDRTLPLREWVEKGETPDLSPYFVLEELSEEKGPWVLLDGYVYQEDLKSRRSCFIFTRGLFVQTDDVIEAANLLREQDLGGRWLPEIPEDYYTYAGEIPWCDTFPNNGQVELEFPSRAKKTGVTSSPASMEEGMFLAGERSEAGKPEERHAFKVSIPVRGNTWEEYHSSVNPGRFALVPAKEIATYLDLCSHPQTFDLFEKDGRRASVEVRWGEPWHTEHHMIFLRQDLLSRFLRKNNLALVWAVWGERQPRSRDDKGLRESAKEHIPSKVFQEIRLYSEGE